MLISSCRYLSGWDFNFDDNLIQEIDPLLKLQEDKKFVKNTLFLRNNTLSENAKQSCQDINLENQDKYDNSKKETFEAVMWVSMFSEAFLFMGSTFALTKFLTDKLLHSVKRFAPISLSRSFNTKKVTWGLPTASLLIGIPLLIRYQERIAIKIYDKTFGKIFNIVMKKF
jgi:hypothetical protein